MEHWGKAVATFPIGTRRYDFALLLGDHYANNVTVDLFAAILTRWQLEDAHVCHGQSTGGSLERNPDKYEVRHQSSQYAHWDREEVDEEFIGI